MKNLSWAVLFLVSLAAMGMEALPEKPPIPADNPMTPAKIALGKKLYFDAHLSKTSTVSCSSCHLVTGKATGVDNLPFSNGINGLKGGRNAPTVWNAAFHSVQFWDGRAASLEEQAKGPLLNPVEMGMESHPLVMKRVAENAAYVQEFKVVFGGENPVTIDNLAKAIAAYERTLITPDAPFDLYIRGDKKALKPAAQRGMKLVQTIGCTSCHMGAMFSGPTLPPGQGFYMKFPTFPNTEYDKKYGFTKDLGRFEVTKKPQDKNMWRVASWRNVALTAPYFHNGSVETLDEAVRVMAKTQLGKDLKPKEVSDIVAFLESLNGKRPAQE